MPAGRSPISLISTVILSDFQRAFFDQIEQASLEFQQLFGRIRAHIDRHPGLAGDGVDGGAATNGADRKRGLGLGGRLQIGDFCYRAAHGMDRARQSELLERVAAGALENHLVAMASGRLVDDAGDAEPVDRDEAVDIGVVAEQRLDAPEIAEFFLADGADEQDVADGRDVVGIDGFDQRQQRGEAAGVIADTRRQHDAVLLPHGNIRAFGEYGVEMRRHHQLRPAAAAALAQTDHIAFGVDRCILEAQLVKPLQIIFGPDFFLVRRRRDFGDALLLGECRGVVGLDVLKGLDHLGVGENALIGGYPAAGVCAHACFASGAPASRSAVARMDRVRIRICSLRICQLNPKPASFSRWENQPDRGWSMTPPT